MLGQSFAGQISLLVSYNVIMLLLLRVVRKWTVHSAQDRHSQVLVMFPFRFMEVLFQYMTLYSIRNILTPKFWVAWLLVLMVNILDTTGLLNDLYGNVSAHFRRRRFSPAGRLSHRRGLEHLASMHQATGGAGFELNTSHNSFNLQDSFGDSQNSGSAKAVCMDIMLTLETIYQKCNAIIILSTSLISAQVIAC